MKKVAMFAGTAGALLMASQAMAVFVPPAGVVNFKLVDGSNVYDSDTLAPRPRAAPGVNNVEVGDIDFTAFRLTSYTVDGGSNDTTVSGVTGILTYLEVKSNVSFGPIALLGVGDDTDRRTAAGVSLAGGGTDPVTGNPTIGRFYLYDNTLATAGDFDAAGGQPGDVAFGSPDTLANFTTGTLLATGSVVADPDGTILDVLTASGIHGVNFSGAVGPYALLIDGGLWFDLGILDQNRASFQINQVAYNNATSSYGQLGAPVGNQNVYDGGWQLASNDPLIITVHPIPEPVTAGLGFLALGGLASYVTARRKA